MSQTSRKFWPVTVAVLIALALVIALPDGAKGWLPGFVRSPHLHLGLDLAGGTQLDFRISEQEIAEQLQSITQEIARLKVTGGGTDEINALEFQKTSIAEQQRNLVEAIRTVLERRINALGVSEATITPSFFGDEKHLLVECPGVVDTQECIETVGKTIQLEFKEQYTEATEEFEAEVKAKATATLRRITESGSTLAKEGQDLGDDLGVSFQERHMFFRDQLPKGTESIWDKKPGRVYQLEGSVEASSQTPDGQPTTETVPGIFLMEVLAPRTQTGRLINEAPKAFALLEKTERGAEYIHRDNAPTDASMDSRIAAALKTMQPGDLKTLALDAGNAQLLFLQGKTPGKEEVEASHILIAYKGASGADKSVTRTKEEALAKAQDLKKQLDAGANFAVLANAQSDGQSKEDGGNLGRFGRGTMVPPFEKVAFSQPVGVVSDPVETQFGYHLIRVDKGIERSPDIATYDTLALSGPDSEKRGNDLIAQMQQGKVRSQEEALTLRTIFFSLKPSGWKDTPLDGKHFRSAAVTVDPTTGIPVVQIVFDSEGSKIFQELTKRNISKPIAIFVGGQLVSAPNVQQEIIGGSAVITGMQNFDQAKQLAQDLNTGAIPAPIHLVGQSTVEATLGESALRTSLEAALIGTIILMLYMIVVYRLLGVIANLALLIYAVLFFAMLKFPLFLFSGTYVVLTLAGMAGIILSLGMAVDANVLVFERLKEELRKGKMVKTAVETSFVHAWPAIRDGNVSTLITCAILFLVGTSIVRGFAITLGIGVVLSMFTAITVTRWILRRVALMPVAGKTEMFGVKRMEVPAA